VQRRILSALVLLSALVTASCQKKPKHTMHVVFGTGAHDQMTAPIESAYAEYVEIPGVGNTLTLTLASYDLPCGAFVSPGDGRVLVSVVIGSPPDVKPTTGDYVWTGHTKGRYAMPSLRIGTTRHGFPPGGSVNLTRVDLGGDATVTGVLSFTFAGDAKESPKSLTGSFEARLCTPTPP
jgi:hypothetical protein